MLEILLRADGAETITVTEALERLNNAELSPGELSEAAQGLLALRGAVDKTLDKIENALPRKSVETIRRGGMA